MAITLYSAGAGTGKTHTLCVEVAERIAKGLDPRRLLAATFTKTAAAELKSRIQAHLLSLGKVEEAEALEWALIGTVHGVGLQLAKRYWLRLGLPPGVEVIPEGGDEELLRETVGDLEPALSARLAALTTRLSQGDEIFLKTLKAKRQNTIKGPALRKQLSASARRFIEILEARAGKQTFEDAASEAQEIAKRAVAAMAVLAGHKDLKSYRVLMALIRSRPSKWADLEPMAGLSETKKSGADDLLEPARSFGMNLRRHPGLAADITAYADVLGQAVEALEDRYQAHKSERGLVDFIDLETSLLRLVTDPALQDELKSEIELVVIDEFQDTYPIQLAVCEALAKIAGDCIWVGDPKQAIYGFAGTDPRLMGSVMTRAGVPKNLAKNRRSLPALVDFFNAVFVPQFGKESKVSAVREGPGEIERWLLEGKNLDTDRAAIARGVADLVAAGTPPSDIAVLTRSNTAAQVLAQALSDLGIPAMAMRPGLLSTRECAAAVAALRLVADRRDGVAAATLVDILSEEPWLEDRLRECQADGDVPFKDHPLLARLDVFDHRVLSPSAAVAAVIDAMMLPDHAAGWGDAGLRGANLDTLLGLAEEYEDGAHGRACTLAGFLGALDDLEADGTDFRRPQAGLEAVTVMTYHKAKGLEWPVVVLSELDKLFPPRLWEPAAYGGEAASGHPLKGREVRFWPFPFEHDRPKVNDLALQSPDGLEIARQEEDESRRLLYVGFTRARDRLVLATRVAANKTGDKHSHSWLDRLPEFAKLAGTALTPGKYKLDGIGVPLLVKRISPPERAASKNARQRWLAETVERLSTAPPRLLSPSDAPPVAGSACTAEAIPGARPSTITGEVDDRSELGQAVHAYFACLPSLRTLKDADKKAVACRLLEGFGVSSAVTPEDLLSAGAVLERWVESRYPGARWWTETPVSAPLPGGSRMAGIIDLLLEGSSFALVDHKSAIAKPAAHAAIAALYSGQLGAYSFCVDAARGDVGECWAHLPLSGAMVTIGREKDRRGGA